MPLELCQATVQERRFQHQISTPCNCSKRSFSRLVTYLHTHLLWVLLVVTYYNHFLWQLVSQSLLCNLTPSSGKNHSLQVWVRHRTLAGHFPALTLLKKPTDQHWTRSIWVLRDSQEASPQPADLASSLKQSEQKLPLSDPEFPATIHNWYTDCLIVVEPIKDNPKGDCLQKPTET